MNNSKVNYRSEQMGRDADSEPVASPFDSLASDYDNWFEREGKSVFTIETEAFREILPLLSEPWLEVGVGSGRFAQALGIGIGVDPSLRLLEMARKRGVNVFLGRGEDTPFTDGVFGAVFVIVTICFADSPLGILTEANRLLKQSGKVVLGLVLWESPWGQFYQLEKEAGHRFYKHATFYRYADVARLLKQSGFRVEKIISTLFQKPGEVKGRESPQDGLSSGAGFTIILAGKSGQENREAQD